ncbi:MAG: hypothetical protein WBJ16_01075 [Smithellaceae bacterium]
MYRLNRITVIFAFVLVLAGIINCAASESSLSIEQTFQKAKKDYLEKNIDSAAKQIKKGAAYMRAEAVKASSRGKKALDDSARELDKLADDVKKGAVESVKKIEDVFARAYFVLAEESYIESTEAWAKKEAVKAGEFLDAANKNLEKGMIWAGQKVEEKTTETMKKSRELSLKLKQKGRLITEEVGKSLQAIGDEIEKFGKRISSEGLNEK